MTTKQVIDIKKHAKNRKTLDDLLGGYSGPTLEKTLYRKALEKSKEQKLKITRSENDVHSEVQAN